VWDDVYEVLYVWFGCEVDFVVVVFVMVDLLVCVVHGLVDDLLINILFIVRCLVLMVLVMYMEMWEYLVICVNVEMLCSWGVVVFEFVLGWLIGVDIGLGWLFELEEIFVVSCDLFVVGMWVCDFVGCIVVVSVGGICEFFDFVCYFGNCLLGK